MNKYKQGDILKDDRGRIKILGVCGELYFLSLIENFNEAAQKPFMEWRLKELGYTLEEQPWEPKEGEESWFIDTGTEIFDRLWDGDELDVKMKNFLGVYPTKEKAEEALVEIKRKLGK